jgi:hypothetical protein
MKKDIMLRKLIEALTFLKNDNGIHLHEDVFLCGKELDGSDKLYGFKSVDNDLYVETRECSDGYPIRDMDKDDLEYIFGSQIYEKILNKEYVQSPLDANNQIDNEPEED